MILLTSEGERLGTSLSPIDVPQKATMVPLGPLFF